MEWKTLSDYLGKTIRIKTKDGRTTQGEAVTFTSSVEAKTGEEDIGIRMDGYIESFDESDIEELTIIE